MKLRYTVIIIAVFLLSFFDMGKEVYARDPESFLIRRYEITIMVDCLSEAINRMAELPGFELSSHISITNGYGTAERIVDSRDRAHTLSQLQRMGNQVSSSSSSYNAFGRWTALRREIEVRQGEYDRLVELLHGTTTMASFDTVESRLNVVIRTMDQLRGSIQGLEFEIGTTVIDISLFVAQEDLPIIEYEEEPEPGPFRRILNAFTSSAGFTGTVLQGAAMFLAYISIPLVGIVAIAIVVVRIARRKKRKGGDENDTQTVGK